MLEKICVGFDWFKEPETNQEYLSEMFKAIKYGASCPKTGTSMDRMYPAKSNFKFFKDKDRLNRYINASKKPNAVYSSHLLDGEKFYLVWNYKVIEDN